MEALTLAVKDARTFFSVELTTLGFEVFPSETNFLWVKPPAPGAKAFFEGLRKRNVFVRWFDGDRTKDYLRITVGTNEQMMLLIEAVEEILGKEG
jgi:histidinol-phosphate aminotransferase